MIPPELSDSVNVDLGELLAVAVQRLESLTTDLLENKHFLRLGVVIDDGSLDDRAFHIRSSDLDGAGLVDEEHLVELDRLTVVSREAVENHHCLLIEIMTIMVVEIPINHVQIKIIDEIVKIIVCVLMDGVMKLIV